MRVLITGGNGFLGRALYRFLSTSEDVVRLYGPHHRSGEHRNHPFCGDITDTQWIREVTAKICPDVVIHCAGIAHQRFLSADAANHYMAVNCKATLELARFSAACNPDVHFIFVSSISVYGGENHHSATLETAPCYPDGPYAISKREAEKGLATLAAENVLKRVDILRLAPVYDINWTLNFEKRVMLFKKIYVQVGTGQQRLSVLSRSNFCEFAGHLIRKEEDHQGVRIFNVCDTVPITFSSLIRIFRDSGRMTSGPVFKIPEYLVRLGLNGLGVILPAKAKLLKNYYSKLVNDFVFDPGQMIASGFKPVHTLETVFSNDGNPGHDH